MRRVSQIIALVAAAGLAGSASAAISFSNVLVSGSLVGGSLPSAIVTTGTADIDFTFPFPAGTVGDPVAPTRAGNIVITFDVDSDSGPIDRDILSILGAVSGSGTIIFNEVVEDRTPGFEGIIASARYTINLGNPPPVFQDIVFSRPSSSFKVKKTLVLFAPDTQAFDVASISLIEQRMVPGPGAMALAAAGGLLAFRRRR